MHDEFDELGDRGDDDDIPIDRAMAPTIGALIDRRESAAASVLRGMASCGRRRGGCWAL